jgi:hypothetical protein
MSFPRLAEVVAPSIVGSKETTSPPDNLATPATSATPVPKVAAVAKVATPDDLAKKAGIRVRLLLPDYADELLAFWRSDLDDLVQLPDEAILALGRDYLQQRDHYGAEFDANTASLPSATASACRCIDCLWFERISHPHLGHCLAREPEPIAGLWDTDRRGCDQFLPLSDERAKPETKSPQ